MNLNKAALLMLLILGLLAAACGSEVGDDGPSAGGLDDRQFWSISVNQGGSDRPLVEGTRIALRFDDATLGASAGCNSMGGSYSVSSGGLLLVSGLGMTEIGCDESRHAQDEFVSELLLASPMLLLDGDRLILSTPDTTVELLDRAVADPDRPILGTEWVVTGFIAGDAAFSMVVAEPAWFLFADDSTMSGFDGCERFTRPVELSDGSVGGPVEGDGELQFGSRTPSSSESSGCGSVQEYVDAFNRLFDTDAASYTIDGPNLTVLNGSGDGVSFRAAEE